MSEPVRNCSYFFADFLNLDIYLAVAGALTATLIVTLVKWRDKLHPTAPLSLILLLGGGAYNVYQRIQTGCVVDYWSFFGLFEFNLADVLITIGLITLVANILMYNDNREVVLD